MRVSGDALLRGRRVSLDGAAEDVFNARGAHPFELRFALQKKLGGIVGRDAEGRQGEHFGVEIALVALDFAVAVLDFWGVALDFWAAALDFWGAALDSWAAALDFWAAVLDFWAAVLDFAVAALDFLNQARY